MIAALNSEVTWLTSKKTSGSVKAKAVTQKPSSVVPGRQVGFLDQHLPSGVGVHYLYQPVELEGGGIVRLTLFGH